jgi:hypothetical protein
MGREESAAQAKEAAKAKEAAAAAKKTVRCREHAAAVRCGASVVGSVAACFAAHAALCAQAAREKQWEVGAKDTSADAEAAAKAAERAAAAAAKRAQEAAEGGGAPVVKQKAGGVVLPKCKACKKPFDPRKGCPC